MRGATAFRLTKTKVALAEAVERSPIRTGDVGIQRLSGGHEPRIVLAHAARRAAPQRTPLCLREMNPLNDEPLRGT
ncbi:MAG TPA: hypothetical protein VGR95_08255 [Thermoanaerobaculia bacterium]|nr:hypothetical protein [Thermoanaerobaculia bacterium]